MTEGSQNSSSGVPFHTFEQARPGRVLRSEVACQAGQAGARAWAQTSVCTIAPTLQHTQAYRAPQFVRGHRFGSHNAQPVTWKIAALQISSFFCAGFKLLAAESRDLQVTESEGHGPARKALVRAPAGNYFRALDINCLRLTRPGPVLPGRAGAASCPPPRKRPVHSRLKNLRR